MDKEKFIKKYGDNNSIKQIFLRKAYQNYFMLRSGRVKDQKSKNNKSVENSSYIASKFKTDQSKSSFIESQTTHKDNMQMSSFHYNLLKSKWLSDEKSCEAFILSQQQKKKLLEEEEKQRKQDVTKIQQAIFLRQNVETERKKQFYKDAELFRSQQSERKQKEFQELKQKEKEYQDIAKKMAENEQLAKLEQQIVHRQKCKLQFQMLEQQRKTNQYLFY